MKYIWLILKIVLFPLWFPFWIQYWVFKKLWRIVLTLLALAVISGCASNSAKFDMSPCAGCDFQPINMVPSRGEVHA